MGEQGISAAIWAFLSKFVLPWWHGYFGAGLALLFIGKTLTFWQKLSAFIAGVAAMYFVAPVIVEVASVDSQVMTDAVKFACGLFGYALIDKLFKDIRETNLIQTIRGIGKK